MTFWGNAGGFLVPPMPTLTTIKTTIKAITPLILVKRARVADEGERYRWRGQIITRAYHGDLPAREYAQMLVGGRARRLRAPDWRTRDGAPMFYLSDAETRERNRLLDRECFDRHETHNIACNAGRAVLLNFVGNAGSLTGVQYFAVGTGSPAIGIAGPQATDTALWTEYYRTTIGVATVSGNQVDLSTLFGSGVANTTYTEAGIFGDGATGTAGSGSLFAHAFYAYTKTAAISLSNDYFIAFA